MIYIVLVNFKGAPDTIACLESLNAHIASAARVVVAENGSQDDSLACLAAWVGASTSDQQYQGEGQWNALRAPAAHSARAPLNVNIIDTGENLGFAGGCNVGVRIALEDPSCTHVWLLNNDTVVKDDALAPMIMRMAEDSGIGMCGSTLVYYDDPDLVQACGGKFNPLTGRGKPIGAHLKYPLSLERSIIEEQLDYAVGASMLVSRAFIERVGMMSERYFLYFEELDWAVRGRRHGFRPGWSPQSVVYHKEGAAIGTSTRTRASNLSIYFMTASYLRFLWAHNKALLPTGIALTLAKATRWMLKGDITASLRMWKALASFASRPKACDRNTELNKAI